MLHQFKPANCEKVALNVMNMMESTWIDFKFNITRPLIASDVNPILKVSECATRHESMNHANAWPHVAYAIQTYIHRIQFKALFHQALGTELALTRYLLFRSKQNFRTIS